MDLEVLIVKFKSDDGGEFASPDGLLEYIQQIQNFFAGDTDSTKLDYYLGLTFPDTPDEGLLAFLKKKITERRYDKPKEQVLNLIQFLLVQKLWRSDVSRFCLRLKIVADMYWRHSKETARLQQAALDCLVSLFENFGSEIDKDTEFEMPKLYWDLLRCSEKTSYQPTVRGKMFHLLGILGVLCRSTIMEMEGTFKQLFNHFTATVKAQVESIDAHLEVSILYGCIKGIDKLLNAFGTNVNPDDKSWILFQDHLEQIVDPSLSLIKNDGKAKIKRREFQRAALELAANHGELFQRQLFKKHQQWFEDILVWSKSSNADDNRIGRRAMYKFLDTVVRHAEQSKDDPESKHLVENMFQYFTGKFKTVLCTKDANKIELGIAVRGFGRLSSLCVDQQQPQEMMDLIMQHIDSINHELNSPVTDKYGGSLAVLSTYLDCIASILPSLVNEDGSTKLSEQHLESTSNLIVLLTKFYPDLGESQRNYCHISVQKVFDSLWKHHTLLCEAFMDQVYRQSLLHIVSCPTRAELDILIESWNKSHPDSKRTALSQLGLKPVTAYMKFWKLLLSTGANGSETLRFDLMMQWILVTIGKLDLTIKFEESEISEGTLDPVQGATASVVKDFQIFVNIVDFFQNLLAEKVLHHRFEKWISRFSQEMLTYIGSNAYVSGFYKILAIVLEVSRSVEYFHGDHEDRSDLQGNLNRFFRSLGTKIREFRDDLLFAVLELWLSLPDTLILANFTALNHTLQTVFAIGRNTYSLAIQGLDAIQRWFVKPEFPVDEVTNIMNSIFPILKTYFMNSDSAAELETSEVKSTKMEKLTLKDLIKKNIQAGKTVSDPTLKETQLKILQLFGSYGQFIRLETKPHSGLSKDPRFLSYAIPFQDCKPEFFLDDLLPRVLELCETAVERQTRISACEFFHTLCLIFIGKSREGLKYALFRRIFQSILKLGCDSDIVVRQLFNSLCLQTIHWFSKKDSTYGDVLLEIISENLVQRTDLGLRELAAVCVGEYFLWSLKHENPKSKHVVKTIFAMSTHASPDFRQASVLAFNSIYRDFREQSDITSEFTFNLLYSFLTSLQLSKDLPEDSLLVTSTKQSIKHLERIFEKKKHHFNTALKRQFKPGIRGSGVNPCLRDVVEWLLTQGGSTARVFRQECLRLVSVLSPLAKETTENFLLKWEEDNGVNSWILIAEGAAVACDDFNFLDASADFYNFLFENKMLKKNLFLDTSSSKFKTTLLRFASQPQLSMREEEKSILLNVFGKLKYAWHILDNDSLDCLWSYSLQLSKEVPFIFLTDPMPALIEVWNFGILSSTLKSMCRSTLLLDPEVVSHVSDRSMALKQILWYRHLAEGGIMAKILPEDDIHMIHQKLWTAIDTALFTQLTSTATAHGCEAHNLTPIEKKIVENYLIIALCTGFTQGDVVDAAFDATMVTQKVGSFHLTTTKGHVFQKELGNALVYCDNLFNFDALLQEKSIKDVGELIQRVLDLLKSDRNLRKKFGEAAMKKTLTNWRMISINCDVSTTVKIFVGLLAIDSEKCKNSEQLSEWWNGPNLIQARHLDLKQKAEVFGYVSIFFSSRKQAIVESTMETVSAVVANELKPSEMQWDDVEPYANHIFSRILKVFEQFPTHWALLRPILSSIYKINLWLTGKGNHYLLGMARETLVKAVKVLYLTDADRIEMVSKLYQLITSLENKMFAESTVVWKVCLLPAVASLGVGATKTFFKKHIYDIMSKAEIRATSLYDWNVKSLGVYLLELLVYQTNSEFIKGAELTTAYVSGAPSDKRSEFENKSDADKLKLVYSGIIKVCVNGITKQVAGLPDDNSDLRSSILNCHEAFYNTLAATMLVTKTEFKFFDKFLFPGKKIFESVVDTTAVYEFPVIIDEALYKTRMVDRSKTSMDRVSAASSINFIRGSGNLPGSSLAPEATSYDFTTSVTVANSEYYQQIFGNPDAGANNMNYPSGNHLESEGGIGMRLEWNEINQHGCMFAFVDILKQMGKFRKENKDLNREWSGAVVKMLNDSRLHKNVKIFLVGGIINAPEILEPFANEFMEPILKLVLADCFGSIKLNHFVQDVLVTLLSWHETGKPSNSSVKNVLNYVLENVQMDEIAGRRDVFQHIMEIFQNIIKYWASGSDLTVIPTASIMSLESSDESSTVMLETCLNVLLGGQLPHGEVVQLMHKFTKACSSRFKAVYTVGARCVGILLRKIKENAAKDIIVMHIDRVVRKVLNPAKTKPSVFVEILSAIHKGFPEIIVRGRSTILELSQRPKIRPELLELLPLLFNQQLSDLTSDETDRSPQTCGDDFFVDIGGRGFFDQPCKFEKEITAGLKLLELLIDNINQPSQLLKMMDWLKSAESSTSGEIRTLYTTCLFRLYNALSSSPMDTSVRRSFLKIFIRMYEDENAEVQEVIQRFWSNALTEWKQSTELLLELFDLVGQEENSVKVCIGLILQRCSLSPDYSKLMFTDPLENCQFHPFELDTSWRLRHSSFQPLFAESLSSMQNFTTLPRAMQSSLLSQRRSVGRFGMNVLRATLANLQFTPTQQDANDSLENLMEVDYDGLQFNSNSTASSNQSNQSNSRTGQSRSVGNPVLKLRKKFYTRKESDFYATKFSEARIERLEQAKDLQRSRISGVKTIRSYRIGELPDILIRHSDLLNTLLKLAKQDESIGQQFLVHLYAGMLGETEQLRTDRKFLLKSQEIFDRVLRNCMSSQSTSLSIPLMEISVCNNISVQLATVLEICKATNMQTVGILKLEYEVLENRSSIPSGSKKARLHKEVGPVFEESWLGMAEMYKEIEEFDVLRNLFVTLRCKTANVSSQTLYERIGDALHLEGQGHLTQALEMFDAALSEDAEGQSECSAPARLFLEDATMHCLSKLSDWSTLFATSENFNTALPEEIFHDPKSVGRLIPMQIMSGMQLCLRNADDEASKKFNDFMKNALYTEEGTGFLTVRYPFDVSAWFLAQGDEDFFPQANLMLEKGYEIVLRQLKNMNLLPLKVQKQIFVSLEQSSIIQDFLHWKKHINDARMVEEVTTKLLNGWRKGFAFQPLDLLGSDIIATHRDFFASQCGIILQELGSINESVLLSIQHMRVDQELWLSDLGAHHKNYVVSHHSLGRLKSSRMEHMRPMEFRKSMARFLSAFHDVIGRSEWCKWWCNVWKKLDLVEQRNLYEIKADLLYSLVEASGDMSETSEFASAVKTLSRGTGGTLSSCILNSSIELLRLPQNEEEGSHNTALYSKMFQLLKKINDCASTDESTSITGENMLRCLLRGCGAGYSNDMLQLSNVFPLLKKYPNLNSSFEEMMNLVPTYMFLPWIDQIITTHRSNPGQYSAFKTLTERMVKEFPQAFQLQYPHLLNRNHQLYAKALGALVLPYKLHEATVGKICKFDGSPREFSVKLNEFQSTLQEIINNDHKIYGESHIEYATEMFQIVSNVIANHQTSFTQLSQSSASENNLSSSAATRSYKKEIGSIHMKWQNQVEKMRMQTLSLEKLSPFLAEFHFFDYEPIELPGLYSHFKKSRIEDHPSIVSFHPTVQLFRSATRPLKFTIITNDGKRNNFLAKIGDDIRQDRRIQQLFTVSNILLQKNAVVSQRDLNIVTYSCIPITADFGIIEMVDNVSSLVEVIFDNQNLKEDRVKMIQEYEGWLSDKSEQTDRSLVRYKKLAQLVGRQEAETFFDNLSKKLPTYTFRDQIKKRTSVLQEFFTIRQDLIKSYGAMCMVHWLLGIGDRHLENSLLSMNSGKIVGIDFGRAFGTSNFRFPVPEMIPFRLTPQFQQLMLPYTYNGLFREICILTWKCLTDAAETILTVADVFIQEPSMDWLNIRQKPEHRDDQESQLQDATCDWTPIDIMKKKLLGFNPTNLLVEELKLQSFDGVFEAYRCVALDGRIHREKEKVSHEEYIDILLDLATDKNILSRIFSGWSSWV